MIIGKDFLLIGMPKTGCIYSKYVLQEAGLIEEFISHTPISQIPAEKKKGKRIIGMVRNPWAWYVSRWADVQLHYSVANGRMEFDPWLREYLYQPKSPPMMSVCRDFPNPSVPLGTFTYTHIAFHCERAADILATWHRKDYLPWNYDDNLSCQVMLKTEELTDKMVATYGAAVLKYLKAPRNNNPHPPYQELYSIELRALVGEADEMLIERYRYSFDEA